MTRRRKYHYETETCYECGHKTRYRVYRSRRQKKGGIFVRDVSGIINSLDTGRGPLAVLMEQAHKHINKIHKFEWAEDKQ